MAKDRSDKEKKKERKEKKRSEVNGVHKSSKKDKDKDKKKATVIAKGLEKDLTEKVLEQLDTVEDISMVVEEQSKNEKRPIGSLVPFANPLADDKVAKKVLKSVKKAAVNKSLKRGVKEVVKAVRKSPMAAANVATTSPIGIVVLAADISPMDVISHIPVLCEDHGIPYVYVTSRAELGSAGATKRPTSVVMVLPRPGGKKKKDEAKDGSEKQEEYSKIYEELGKIVQKEASRVKI
ncbi:snoRNA-binding protein [Emydomyces testavorans]|uniref:H/ACA ribonucleoprotein complex subunit 2 n=1 Tax=Emydomyces testavorans TaxID=2070801 RepID=A0AAF0IHM1_9EURO|nr:snoRNA-binding protein [Emydomyces testavorans]